MIAAVILPLRALWVATHWAYRRAGFESRLLRAGTRNLHLYDRRGEGRAPPVLMVHGIGGNAAGFLPVARMLVRTSKRVVALELPGHGRSHLQAGEMPASAHECAQALGAALSDVGEPAVLVGNSLGGALSLVTAAALPGHTAGVVGLNPAGAPLRGADREAVVRAFRGGSAAAALEMNRLLYVRPPRLGWLFARDLGRHWASPPVQKFFSDIDGDVPGIAPEVLSAIDKPVLILWGEGDRILPASSVEYFRSHLRRGSVEIVPGAGHVPMIEASRLVAARIRRFLAEL